MSWFQKLLQNAQVHAALVNLEGVANAVLHTFWAGVLTYFASSALGFTNVAAWQGAAAAGLAAVVAALGSGTIDIFKGRQDLKVLNAAGITAPLN